MMSPVTNLPWDTHPLRSFTSPEVLAASASPTMTALMTDLAHQNRLSKLQLKPNSSQIFGVLPWSRDKTSHLQKKIPHHGAKKLQLSNSNKLVANRLGTKTLSRGRKKRSQILDQDLTQALSTLVTHQEESPISPWDEHNALNEPLT